MLVSVDVYRPAAREQLRVVANSIKAKIYEGDAKGEAPGTALVERLAKEARREAIISGCDTLIVDTAGRLHIDADLMDEMAKLKSLLSPQEILFIADAMTGQDAVRSAEEFHKRLALTGVVLTKMDGDARGGAALSIRHVTGQPIKFIGVGEKPDAFEPFHPDRIVSRILGMGDIMTLIEKAEENLDRKKSEEFAKKALSGDGFSLEDFRDQLRQIRKLGSLQSIMKMLPSVGPFQGMQQMAGQVDEKQFVRVEAIINSMTQKERNNHEIISGTRRKRIANGSGTTVQEVNQLCGSTRRCARCSKVLAKAACAAPRHGNAGRHEGHEVSGSRCHTYRTSSMRSPRTRGRSSSQNGWPSTSARSKICSQRESNSEFYP